MSTSGFSYVKTSGQFLKQKTIWTPHCNWNILSPRLSHRLLSSCSGDAQNVPQMSLTCHMSVRLLSLQLMQHYEVQPEHGAPTVEPKTRVLLIPSKPINLRFLSRS